MTEEKKLHWLHFQWKLWEKIQEIPQSLANEYLFYISIWFDYIYLYIWFLLIFISKCIHSHIIYIIKCSPIRWDIVKQKTLSPLMDNVWPSKHAGQEHIKDKMQWYFLTLTCKNGMMPSRAMACNSRGAPVRLWSPAPQQEKNEPITMTQGDGQARIPITGFFFTE